MTEREAEEHIVGYLSRLPGWARLEQARKASLGLLKGRVLDSVSLLEFATFLETRFGIEIPPEDITEENFDSIEGVVRYLRARGRVAEAAG
jgi:acyl carrier protein